MLITDLSQLLEFIGAVIHRLSWRSAPSSPILDTSDVNPQEKGVGHQIWWFRRSGDVDALHRPNRLASEVTKLHSSCPFLMDLYVCRVYWQVVNTEQLKQRLSAAVITGIQRWTTNRLSCCGMNARKHLPTEAYGVDLNLNGLFL